MKQAAMEERAGENAPPLTVMQNKRRHQSSRGKDPFDARSVTEARKHLRTADVDLPKVADHVEDDEEPRDHAIMTVRASSSEIACRSPSISMVTGPPSGAFSSTCNDTPGRTPT